MSEHAYYKVGSRDKIVISNSAMSAINPTQGGDPLKFLDFFDSDKEQKSTRSLDTGKVVHAYIEDASQFAIDDLDKPSEGICKIADEMYKLFETKDYEFKNPELLSESRLVFSEMSQALFLGGKHELETEDLISIFFQARENVKYNPKIKDDTVVSKFKNDNGVSYIMFKLLNSDSHILSLTDKVRVESCIKSLKENAKLKTELFEPEEGFKMYKEVGVYFVFPVKMKTGEIIKLRGKILIDVLKVKDDGTVAIINDLKTTAKSIYDMSPDRKRGTMGTIESYRYHRQLGWYSFGLQCLANPDIKSVCKDHKGVKIDITLDKNVTIYSNIIAVQTMDYFRSGILSVGAPWILKGQNEIRDIIERIAFHTSSDNWNTPMEEQLGKCITLEHPIER